MSLVYVLSTVSTIDYVYVVQAFSCIWKEHIVYRGDSMTEYDVQINARKAAYKTFEQGPEKYPGDQYCSIVHIYMCIIYYWVQSFQYYIGLVFLKKYKTVKEIW